MPYKCSKKLQCLPKKHSQSCRNARKRYIKNWKTTLSEKEKKDLFDKYSEYNKNYYQNNLKNDPDYNKKIYAKRLAEGKFIPKTNRKIKKH